MDNDHGWSTQKASKQVTPRLPQSRNLIIQLSRKIGIIAARQAVMRSAVSVFDHPDLVSSPERLFGSVVPKLVYRPYETPERMLEERRQTLKKTVNRSHEVLMTVNTVFPITLFPDSVTVDRTKVTITRRDFFWSSNVLSIRIEDVLNVQVSVGPFFGSLTIASRVMSTIDHFQINHLWRNDAIRLKHIIQGYVIAQHNSIDTSHLNKIDLVETLIELGHDSNV